MTKEAEKAPKKLTVYEAISLVTERLAKEGISKDRKADTGNGGKYNFRGIDDVYNALAPFLAEAGLNVLPHCLSREVVERHSAKGTALFYVTVCVRFDFVSKWDGSKHEVCMYGEAMDTSDKATNKAMSAAYKYACMQAFCIPTEGDNDTENASHEVKAKPAVFANSSLRNTYFKNVIDSFENSETEEELNQVIGLNKLKFAELDASENEHDKLCIEELRKRFVLRQAAIRSSAIFNQQQLDNAARQ
jgi:hypothetical protein